MKMKGKKAITLIALIIIIIISLILVGVCISIVLREKRFNKQAKVKGGQVSKKLCE